MKKIYSMAIITLLLLSGIAILTAADAQNDGGDARANARKQVQDITEFNPTRDSVELSFPQGGGSDNSLNITIPKRSKVLSASMDVEGLPKLDEFVYDFNDVLNTSAWEGDISTIPPASSPTDYDDTSLTNTEISNIQKTDSAMAQYIFAEQGSGNSTTGRPYHMFGFTITDLDASVFNFYWTGEGNTRTGIGGSINEVYVYIFNVLTSKWEQVAYKTTSAPGAVKLTVNKDTTSASNYVDTNSTVFYMVVGPSITSGLTKGWIATDYVKLTVSAGNMVYPSNIAMDIGDDGTNDWTHPAVLNTEVTIDDTSSFKSKLQGMIDNAGTDEGTFILTFKFTVGTEGRLLVDNLNISLEVLEANFAPLEIPDKLTVFIMTEDNASSGDDLVDLSACFTDDHDSSDSLIYELTFQEDAEKLSAELDIDGYHLDFTSAEDYYGTLLFRVNATDSGADEVFDTFDDLSVQSNLFQVTVSPVNDVPELTLPAEPLTIDEGEILKFNVTIDDPDDKTFVWVSNATEKIKITLDTKNFHKVSVAVTPDEDDTGKLLHVQLECRDSGGGEGPGAKATGYADAVIDVINLNDAPEFVEFTLLPDIYTEKFVSGAKTTIESKYAAVEDQDYDMLIVVEDTDIGIDPDETLTYSVVAPEEMNGTLNIDAETGELKFTPANGDVGTFEFTIIVIDHYAESAEQEIELTVNNRNDPPRDPKILKPEVFLFTTNDTIDLQGECTDDDLDIPDTDEALTFMWFTNQSTQPLGIGEELNGVKLNAGWHKITLKVIDSKSEFVETSIDLLVEKMAEGPGPVDNDPGDDPLDDDPLQGRSSDDKQGTTVYLATLAIIIIVVGIIAFLGFMKFKQKKKVEEDETDAAVLQQTEMGQFGYPVMPGMQPMYPQGQPQQMQPPMQPMQYGMPMQQQVQPQQMFGYPGAAQPQQVPQQLPAGQELPMPAAAQTVAVQQPVQQSYDPGAINAEAKTTEPGQPKDDEPV